ncbi:hypothetical protein, partial [Nocardiopsis sp. MG754419]|uniref:hypothetical protein n=1 Tax=Nocardiopsis sp. MG754419 TaxID=2259865 RepID=UPI001BA765C8
SPPPPPPPHGPPPSGYPAQPPAPRRGPRTALTVAITATATLAVAGILTWTVFQAFGSSAGVTPARGLPTDDPCASLGESTLAEMDAEVTSWNSGTYAVGCTWMTGLAGGDEVYLHLTHSVAQSAADVTVMEEFGEEDVPRDADELYEAAVTRASESLIEVSDEGYVDADRRSLTYGDESTIVLLNVDYGYSDDLNQRVSLIVREGDLVSVLSYNLSSMSPELDLAEAEELIATAADDVFG